MFFHKLCQYIESLIEVLINTSIQVRDVLNASLFEDKMQTCLIDHVL